MSVPFYNEQFSFNQPDGTKLQVRGWGDQHHAVFETLDGYTVVEDPVTGFYHYADLVNDELKPTGIRPESIKGEDINLRKNLRNSRSVVKAKVFAGSGLPPGKSRWRQRREEAKTHLVDLVLKRGVQPAPPKRETTGSYVGLCLLIQFPDVQGTITREEVDLFCNQKGYTGFGNNGSVHDYFFEISGGRLSYTNLVAPYYTAKHPRAYYTNEKIPQPERAIELIQEALSYHVSNGFDFSQLTVDNLNYVFALNVFYAGEVVNNWAKGLWPHSHYLSQSYPLGGGKNAHDYQITSMDNELSLGTFCHENGHMICDFPDLYDYGYESRGVGSYCLMCAGANADKKNPVHVGAYLKYKAGWASKLTQLSPGQQIDIGFSKNEFCVLRKDMTEYYILEGRDKKGRDASLPGEGLLIWHVDELGDNSNEQMNNGYHYECSLVQADGKNDLENGINDGDAGDVYHAPDASVFAAATRPAFKWWDQSAVPIEIFDISKIQDPMSFSTR